MRLVGLMTDRYCWIVANDFDLARKVIYLHILTGLAGIGLRLWLLHKFI